LYVGSVFGGVLFGVVLSKLMFLLLLRICRLSAEVHFVFECSAFTDTMRYFGVVFAVNCGSSLWQVGRAQPVELMSSGRKGEREPKLLWIYAMIGAATLICGYWISITSQVDSMIFIAFFGAVFLVIIGTYLLFTSGSVAFLKWMKTRKGLYYSPKNFITVSGMLYRMKKSAAGLSNICIFSTMTLITLICTVSLAIGLDGSVHFEYPYDMMFYYKAGCVTAQEVEEKTAELTQKYGITTERADLYQKIDLPAHRAGNRFDAQIGGGRDYNDYAFYLMTLADYNRMENREIDLSEEEALIYCSGMDFGYDTVDFMGIEFQVKEELADFFPYPKAEGNGFNAVFVMVVKDRQVWERCVDAWCKANGIEDMDGYIKDVEKLNVEILLSGEDKQKQAFLEELGEWGQGLPGFNSVQNGMERRENGRVMYGALLFVGILFALIFFMCLILIMYYKQVTEGYEDRDNFIIMQKVGMSDGEIHDTVHRQIFMVFGLPLLGALMHTAAGMFMVKGLFAVLSLFDMQLIVESSIGVSVLFATVYGASYLVTAKTYYRIVKQG
ncbi:MAG: hypothetical protein K2N00_08135, partial [Lachnospiraceae bacterium]|nr:hypothetical protein [Lachnospiraceae bacterium]